MANNDGFLDILSESTLKELRETNMLVLEISKNIDKANAKIGGSKTPGTSDSAIKALNDQIVAQEKAIGRLQYAYTKLSEEQKKKNVASVQERVDNSILLQQQKQNATIISEVAGAYRILSAEEARSARAVQDLISRGRLATQTQKQFNAEVRKAQTEFDGYRKRVLSADAAVGRWQRTGTRTIQGANELAGALGFTLGITGVVMLGKAIFDTTRELQGLDLALNQVIGSQEEAAKTQEFLSRIAEAYGINIQTLTRSYIGFFASAKNAIDEGKITGEQINQIFESVAKAAGALGLSVDQQQGAFLAIQQMISKGNIQAEELRGQLSERLPGAFGILAKSMGVTEIQLNKMLKDGKVLAAEVLPAFAKELEKAYGVENLRRVETLNASVTRLGNSWTDFVASLNDGGGAFSSGLAAIVDKLAEAVKGASIILQSEESRRNDVLSSIRQKAYDNTLAYYNSLEKIDEAYIVRKRIQHLETIKDLQDQVRINKEANDEIRRLANSGNYVEDAPNSLKTNQLAIRSLNGQIKAYYGMIAAGDAILQKNNKTVKEKVALTDKERKAIEKMREELLKNASARRISDLERQKFLIEQRLDDESKYADDKIQLSQMIADKEIAIATEQFLENLRLHAKSKDLQAIDANNFRTSQEKSEKEHQDRVLKIQTDRNDAFREDREKNGRLTGNNDGSGFAERYLPTEDLDKLIADWEDFKKKQLETEKEYNDKLKQETSDYLSSFRESLFSDYGLGAINIFFDGTFKKLMEGAESTAEQFAVAFVSIAEVAQQAFNIISNASQARFDKERENLEKEKNLSIKFAGENDDAVKAIEEQAERRRREIAIREAKAKKDLAIFNAIVDTAQAVVAELAKGGYAAAIIAAAFGAAQIAIISSTDIPQYWKGTENAPGGLAWTQERGAEAIFSKEGKLKSKGSDKGATLTKLDKGDIVKDANWTRKHLMFDNGLNNILSNNGISMPSVNFNNDNSQLISEMRSVKSAIENIPQPVMSTDNDRLSNFIKIQSRNQFNVNARLRGHGKTFER